MRYVRWMAVVAVVFVCLSRVHATEIDVQGEVELAVHSAFVWRGEVINDEEVISPYLVLRASGWRLSAWGSWDLTDQEEEPDHARTDVMLEYAHAWNGQLLSIGSTAYIYPDEEDAVQEDTFEAFLGYTVDVPSLPSLTVYYDFGEIDGVYASFSLRHSFALVDDRLAVDVGTSIGGGDEEYVTAVFTLPPDEGLGLDGYTPDGAAFLDFNVTVDLPIELSENFTLMPGGRYMEVVDSELEDALEASGRDSDETLWSVRATYYF